MRPRLRYEPLRKAALVEELRRLGSDFSESAVLAFADQRGALTRGQSTLPHVTRDMAPRLAELPLVGEPIGMWAHEAPSFAEVVDVWRAVDILQRPRAADRREVKDARRLIRERFDITDRGLRYTNRDREGPYPRPGHPGRTVLAPDSPGNARVLARLRVDKSMVGAARYFVHRSVNESLEGEVSPAVLPFRDSTIRFWPHSLLGAIYLLLAAELSGHRMRERPCDWCGVPFSGKRRDARFCDEPCRSAWNYRHRRGGAGQ